MTFERKGWHINAAVFSSNLCFILLLLLGCSSPQSGPKENASYVAEIQKWHKKRIESLTNKHGWLTLAGLFWLEEGENSFGADSLNKIIFPAGKAPDFVGSFILKNQEMSVRINLEVEVLNEGKPVRFMVLESDIDDNPTMLTLRSLSWFIIKRGKKFAVRLRDSNNPKLLKFKGIEIFPIDPAWSIKAKFEPYDPPKIIPLPTILGTIIKLSSPGALVFKVYGEIYRLDPIADPDDRQFFVIFSDETSGEETYGGGRFLSVERPAEDGKTIIDFNRAYNPPCAFTEFATCPLPPLQNRLPIKVTAGEKKYAYTTH